MQILITLLLSAIAVFVAAYLAPGVQLDSFPTAIVVAVVLGIVNAFIRPIALILTLPINVLTLGLFTFVIIGGCVLLVSAVVPGFEVHGMFEALIFAALLAITNAFLGQLDGPGRR